MIKAIPTRYGSVEYRSRLEARWALFFDYVGLRFEYEPGPFFWQDRLGYLPDFKLYIPMLVYNGVSFSSIYDNGHHDSDCGSGLWFEVKPYNKKLTDKGKTKINRFAKRCGIILLQGDPFRYKANYLTITGDVTHMTLVRFIKVGNLVGLLAILTKDSKGRKYVNLPAMDKTARAYFLNSVQVGLESARIAARMKVWE